MKEDKIVWDEVKDNLKILRIDESQIIDIGNPFGSGRAVVPQPVVKIRERFPRAFVFFCLILILLVGFFAYRGEYAYSIARMSENWEPTYFMEMKYSLNAGLVQCTLSVDVNTSSLDGSVIVEVEDMSREMMTANHLKTIHEFFPQDKRTITVTFYKESSLFGARTIHSSIIYVPHIVAADGRIEMTNDSTHRFLVFSLDGGMRMLYPEDELSVLGNIAESTVMLFIDLETKVEYRIYVSR